MLSAFLAACAGGGGSAPAIPGPSSPTPTSFGFSSQPYSVSTVNSAIQQVPVTVTISDNNAASSFGAVNFDGDQTVQVQVTDGSSVYNQTFTTADYKGNSPQADPRTGISSAARALTLTSWEAAVQSGSSTDDFYIFNLQKSVNGVGTAPSYVSLANFYSLATPGACALGCYQLLGTLTPAANMPLTGAATFNGEAFGQFIPAASSMSTPATNVTPFLATVVMNVDFTKTIGAVSGTVDNLNQTTASDALRFSMNFTANINGASFSGTATAADAGGASAISKANSYAATIGAPTSLTGVIQGGFYGPSTAPASEAGGTFALVGLQYKTLPFPVLVGGFVAGH